MGYDFGSLGNYNYGAHTSIESWIPGFKNGEFKWSNIKAGDQLKLMFPGIFEEKKNINWEDIYNPEDYQKLLGVIANYGGDSAFKKDVGLLQQQIAYQMNQANKGMSQRTAAQTGGRVGSTERGYQDIGGQYALALQQGIGELRRYYNEQEMKKLQAYIDVYGMDQNAKLALARLQADAASAEGSGLGGIISAVGSIFSDRRLKENIEVVGSVSDLNLYRYNYKWSDEKHVGFMADEVIEKYPECVSMVHGYKAINYAKLLGTLGEGNA
jgi:hypothetical protein